MGSVPKTNDQKGEEGLTISGRNVIYYETHQKKQKENNQERKCLTEKIQR